MGKDSLTLSYALTEGNMNAIVVFVHGRRSLVVLKFAHDDFVIVHTPTCGAILEADDIVGDPGVDGVKWFLNITHSKLIDVQVLGRYPTLKAALRVADPQATFSGASRRNAFVAAQR